MLYTLRYAKTSLLHIQTITQYHYPYLHPELIVQHPYCSFHTLPGYFIAI